MTKPIQAGLVSAPGTGATPLRSSLWLWVSAAFLFLALLWAGLFLAARSAKIESVPLAPKGARP